MPRRLMLVVLTAVLLASPALADPITITETTLYYDITGATVAEIASSIRQNMPDETQGFVGLTGYTFKWTYDYAPDRDEAGKPNCEVSNPEVAITITTHLPRHRTIRNAPDAVTSLWKDYSVALQRHEAHHAEDFIAIGSQIPAAIDAVETPDCSTIEATANALGMDYVARAQAAGDALDATTDHGMTEGASFPGL